MNPKLAAAAMTLVGVPFRLHGRDPATGLDCVGLVAEAMRRAGFLPVAPENYTLRSISQAAFLPFAQASGLTPVGDGGDVLLVQVNPVQPHLLVAVAGGFVHAHAGLGSVTFLPGALPWRVTRRWCVSSTRI